jgi:hypothetical protein
MELRGFFASSKFFVVWRRIGELAERFFYGKIKGVPAPGSYVVGSVREFCMASIGCVR